MSARRYRRGDRVRTNVPIVMGEGHHPAGMTWVVMGSASGGYRLRADVQCPHCGVRPVLPRVDAWLLDPVP